MTTSKQPFKARCLWRAVLGALLGGIGALLLFIALIYIGFLACALPLTTQILARATSLDDVSIYSKSELVDLAQQARDYTVDQHNEVALVRAQARALIGLISDGRMDAPGLDGSLNGLGINKDNLGSLMAAAALTDSAEESDQNVALIVVSARDVMKGISEAYVLSDNALSHLDDCYRVISAARPIVNALSLAALVALILCACITDRRRLGGALIGAGVLTIVALVALGTWALIDFNSLFAIFHSLFFQAGTWTFPWDSLLICMYPEGFWTGMAAVWAITSIVCGVLVIAIGVALRVYGSRHPSTL